MGRIGRISPQFGMMPMTTRTHQHFVHFCLFVAIFFSGRPAGADGAPPPKAAAKNVVVMVADDLGLQIGRAHV